MAETITLSLSALSVAITLVLIWLSRTNLARAEKSREVAFDSLKVQVDLINEFDAAMSLVADGKPEEAARRLARARVVAGVKIDKALDQIEMIYS